MGGCLGKSRALMTGVGYWDKHGQVIALNPKIFLNHSCRDLDWIGIPQSITPSITWWYYTTWVWWVGKSKHTYLKYPHRTCVRRGKYTYESSGVCLMGNYSEACWGIPFKDVTYWCTLSLFPWRERYNTRWTFPDFGANLHLSVLCWHFTNDWNIPERNVKVLKH